LLFLDGEQMNRNPKSEMPSRRMTLPPTSGGRDAALTGKLEARRHGGTLAMRRAQAFPGALLYLIGALVDVLMTVTIE
jgi:hypothetical protein